MPNDEASARKEIRSIIDRLRKQMSPGDHADDIRFGKRGLVLAHGASFTHERAMLNAQLGRLKCLDFTAEDRQHSIREGIRHLELALEDMAPTDEPHDWVVAKKDLGNALAYLHTPSSLKDALKHYREALRVATLGTTPMFWAHLHTNVANVYREMRTLEWPRYSELAIRHYRRALRATSALDTKTRLRWAIIQANLGNAFLERVMGDRSHNVERAIECYERALSVMNRGAHPAEWSQVCNNLGNAHAQRSFGSRSRNVARAVRSYKQALEARPYNRVSELWAQTHNNLGEAYKRASDTRPAKHPERALCHLRLARFGWRRARQPDKWALIQHNIGDAYLARLKGNRIKNLERAIVCFEAALEIRTIETHQFYWARTQAGLARAYGLIAAHSDRQALGSAVRHGREALRVFTADHFAVERAEVLESLGGAHCTLSLWTDAVEFFAEAQELRETRLVDSFTEIGRLSDADRIWRTAAYHGYCLLKQGQYDAALVVLEQGRARLFRNSMRLLRSVYGETHKRDQSGLQRALDKVRVLEYEMREAMRESSRQGIGATGDRLAQARRELADEVVGYTVASPGDVDDETALARMLRGISTSAVLVVPLIMDHETAVFAIPGGTERLDEENMLLLPHMSQDRLETMLVGNARHAGLVTAYRKYVDDPTQAASWMNTLDSVLDQVGKFLMQPILERIKKMWACSVDRLIIVAPGGLGLIPLHAAVLSDGQGRRSVLDEYSCSYGVSIAAVAESERADLKPVGSDASVLAIRPSSDLRYVGYEVAGIQQVCGSARVMHLAGGDAHVENVLEHMRSATYIHFACHGRFEWDDVMQSCLELTDTRLTLGRLLRDARLPLCRLVVLSACETGMADLVSFPSEALGFPNAFVQVGAAGVIGSLWVVNDAAAALFMREFYRRHVNGGALPAAALRQAALFVRDLDARTARRELRSLGDESLLERFRVDSSAEGKACQTGKPFEHPRFWAAFAHTGW